MATHESLLGDIEKDYILLQNINKPLIDVANQLKKSYLTKLINFEDKILQAFT